ncbi:hypothetical protein WICPIJ_007988 [Wickerhamomyces pijperi]|uniref:Probable electron transfer flavoprotein subunit alpha n=1 Tax=Wickerhamomyces pijperi TaxID=599730 RepID=A0A9P8Q1J9_WICPI|nr:hypothetical protein WICPIJ_007988 [Wickerhamomyces pijperi]
MLRTSNILRNSSRRVTAATSLKSFRFGSTLAFIEASNGQISSASLSALTAAKQLGNPIIALTFNEGVADSLNKIEGLSKIVTFSSPEFEKNAPEVISPILSSLIGDSKLDISHFIIGSNATGKNILPRVGALLDVQPISDVVAIESDKVFKKPIYAGNVIQTVETTDPKTLLSVRPSSFAPIDTTATANYEIEQQATPELNKLNIKFVSENLTSSKTPDLATSKIIVSGGRALKSKENFDNLIYPLAAKINAAVGATRAAVDAGFVENSLQIGQTGKIVSPELYFSLGISGAIQHLAGMKDSKVIVAINKDEESPIFNVADVGLVGDLFEIIPELTEKL